MKLKAIGALTGLVAALGLTGCDDNKNTTVDSCQMNGMEVKAVYHERYTATDFITLEFYANGKLIANIAPDTAKDLAPLNYVICDDGRKIGIGTTFWGEGEFIVNSESL